MFSHFLKINQNSLPTTIIDTSSTLLINLDHIADTRDQRANSNSSNNNNNYNDQQQQDQNFSNIPGILNDPFTDEKNLPGEITKDLESNLLKVCNNVNTDELTTLFLSCQAKLLAGIHTCFSMGFDLRMNFRFSEFPLIKRKWIIKDRHPYFRNLIEMQFFKVGFYKVVSGNNKKDTRSDYF